MKIKFIRELMIGEITKDKFLELNSFDKTNLFNTFYKFLESATIRKSAYDIDIALYLIFLFDLVNEELLPLLNNLIISDWHEQHENIAIILQELRSPSSVENLFTAINKKYNYLDYDDSCALAVKCIWCLGDIGNDKAKDKLNILAKSSNVIISNNAVKQLKHLNKRSN